MGELEKRIQEILPEVRELRHELHRHPELGYEEHGTAKRILEFIGAPDGVEIRTKVAGTGLVVLVGKDKGGPCVALRADMDALAIEEESGVEWKSTIPGKMHACGHDGHSAMLAGAARILVERAGELSGPVKLIFQPAEEGGGGGQAMCQAGVLRDPAVAAIFGLHNNLPDPGEKIGRILYTSGPAMAGTGTFDIEVVGKGGHAGFPHRCIDPIPIGAAIVGQLQGIVSRMVNPLDAAVVSVTQFHAGTTHNITPARAILKGTFRALDNDLLVQLRDSIVQRATEVAGAHGAETEIRCEIGYPVLVNEACAEAVFRKVLEEIGEDHRLQRCAPIMGGEDFAYYLDQIPGFFYFLPACPDGRDNVPMCHNSAYDFNDDLLPDGIRLHVETALRFARLWKP